MESIPSFQLLQAILASGVAIASGENREGKEKAGRGSAVSHFLA